VNFYKLEEFPLHIVAITGTNGKSSTAFFYKQICNFSGLKACSIGTIGVYSDDDEHKELKLTTPDISELCEIIRSKACNGIYDIAIEASSHGLDQYRIDGLPIESAGFTNFSHDHLDYHNTIDKYWQAKSRLFYDVIDNENSIVINNDDPKALEIKNICLERGINYTTYGIKNESDIQITEYSINNNFTYYVKINIFEKSYCFTLKILGEFQLYNLMLAIGLFNETHPERVEFVFFPDGGGEINELIAPPGRMEVLQSDKENDYIVVLDYAHTTDALENLMLSVKQFSKNKKILLVFGCGGDRDKEKRPQMGKIAKKYADFIILTDDNPRNENPDSIRLEVKNGINDFTNYLEIPDRKNAIKTAIQMNYEYKIIVIAGKGHEKKQIINKIEYDFDDKEVAKSFM
jgi:UDP-N-acetylmuramoyl-L-alanyl-D-glutamate--2,6-diaminopimelate ligase